MYNIVKIIGSSREIVKTVCRLDEAERLLEVVFRSDSFERYVIEEKD